MMETRNYPYTITGAEAQDFMKEVRYGLHVPCGNTALNAAGITKEPYTRSNDYERMHVSFFTDKE